MYVRWHGVAAGRATRVEQRRTERAGRYRWLSTTKRLAGTPPDLAVCERHPASQRSGRAQYPPKLGLSDSLETEILFDDLHDRIGLSEQTIRGLYDRDASIAEVIDDCIQVAATRGPKGSPTEGQSRHYGSEFGGYRVGGYLDGVKSLLAWVGIAPMEDSPTPRDTPSPKPR